MAVLVIKLSPDVTVDWKVETRPHVILDLVCDNDSNHLESLAVLYNVSKEGYTPPPMQHLRPEQFKVVCRALTLQTMLWSLRHSDLFLHSNTSIS
ncbi:hypothetical protein RRG08_035964 [Elysia crispata]|uniref:Uncharacterized protein n=1 Tax=Elysia crispata TaxID=231223 RepID=A0AAE1AT14_9GAST|nr:hypothetical protein RRG08_035964 [Elysia crispata]